MLLSASELISQSVALYKTKFKSFLPYIGLISVVTIVTTLIGTYLFPIILGSSQSTWITSGESIVISIITGILNLWFMVALINAIAQLHTGQKITPLADMLKGASNKIIPAFLASLLVAVMTVAGFIFFIVPGLLFMIWFIFTTQGIALDNKKPIAAIKASKQLVTKRWWPVFWRIIAPGFVFIIIIWIAQFIIGFLLTSLTNAVGSSTAMSIVSSIVLTLTAIVFLPLTSIAQTILYLDLQSKPYAKSVQEVA